MAAPGDAAASSVARVNAELEAELAQPLPGNVLMLLEAVANPAVCCGIHAQGCLV